MFEIYKAVVGFTIGFVMTGIVIYLIREVLYFIKSICDVRDKRRRDEH